MNMRIAGQGKIPPGEYEKISLAGSTRLFGAVKCNSLRASGSLKGEDVVCAEEFKTSGRALFSGKIQAKDVRVAGSLTAGTVEAQNVKITGALRCEGELNAELIELGADRLMTLGSIRGKSILIKRKRLSPFLNRRVVLTSFLEGENLSLSFVACPRVTGKTVVIGKGCQIDLVQYSDTIQILAGAKVGNVQKI